MRLKFAVAISLLLLTLAPGKAEPAQEPGAPTVTLWYEAEESLVFYNEVTVLRSAPSSYFSVCGWQSGYFGIQELNNGKKVVIFSVWDSDNDDPAGVAESERVKAVKTGHSVRIGRFGNEGSGGQSFLDYQWENGVTYSFVVTAKKKDGRMEYSAFFRAPDMETWYFIATFSTNYSPHYLTALYSFIEDFERTPQSAQRKREAVFSNGWVQFASGRKGPLNRAEFAADRKSNSLDAMATATGFQAAIGGNTKNVSTRLDLSMEWRQRPGATPPVNFP